MSFSLKNYLASAAVTIFTVASSATVVNAGIVVSNIGVNGSFSATLGGGGTADLNSASGTFRQWLLFTHANIGVSANPQNVPITVSSPGVNSLSASGTVNLEYNNVTPGTPLTVHSAVLDLTGGNPIPYAINVGNIQINTSLGNFNLALTATGSITNFGFVSTGAGAVSGGAFALPGTFSALIGGTVTGQLVGVPIIGNVNLGTITSFSGEEIEFEGLVPGEVTTTDLDGIGDPFPHDMLANFQVDLGDLEINVPLDLPLNVAISQSIPNGQSGFSVLNVDAQLNAELILSNINYNLEGTVAQTLQNVPEPTSATLALLGLTAMTGFRRRR